MLAQSVLDGFNVSQLGLAKKKWSSELMGQVCIFAYGQTGSGKSWTMEGGQVSAVIHPEHRTPDLDRHVSCATTPGEATGAALMAERARRRDDPPSNRDDL